MNDSKHCQETAWLHDVVREYEPRLVRYAARLLGDVERARDVVQDAFVRLCREDQSRIRDRVGPWLFTVCRNRAMDIRKKEGRMNNLSESQTGALPSQLADHTAVVERQETLGQALKLLGGLPENQQEVIRLKIEGGLSYREISEVTGHSISNVGFLIHKGIKTIRERFLLREKMQH